MWKVFALLCRNSEVKEHVHNNRHQFCLFSSLTGRDLRFLQFGGPLPSAAEKASYRSRLLFESSNLLMLQTAARRRDYQHGCTDMIGGMQ